MQKDHKRHTTSGPSAVAATVDLRNSGAEPLWRQVLREPVALGLAPLILFRPLLDGATWPTDNFYFVWVILALGCLFLARMLMRGAELRFKLGTLLLGLFWLAGLATLATTVQYSVTYRATVIWAGHFFLFLAVVNGVRSRLAIRIVLAAMIVSFLAETAYSFIHFKYVLPMMRQMVMQDSYLLRTGVGADIESADLVHRLQTNRAAGSLLFPNALAAFLILAIPITFAEMLQAFWALSRRSRAEGATARPSPLALCLTVSLSWLTAFCLAYFLVPLASPGFGLPFILFVVLAPMVLAAAVGVALKRGGWMGLGVACRLSLLPLLLAGEVWMLWLTYSRGGMLALTMVVVLAALILFARRTRIMRRVPPAAGMVLMALLLALPAADTTTPPAPTGLTAQGRDMSASDLASSATFALRLSYWRTGLYMAADNLWTGVGLGNFGAAYPNYRPPDAGPVTKAHNDYLQVLCETGIFGFAIFCAFWAYIAWWGLKRIWHEQDRRERWAILGLYTGLLAFLAHSVIDFNFQNPSLAFFAFLSAGLVVSRGSLEEQDITAGQRAPTWRSLSQLAALPLLLAVALVAGMGFRAYISDFIKGRGDFLGVGDSKKLDRLYYAGEFFFPPAELSGQTPAARQIPVTHLAGLVPLRSTLENAGEFLVPGSKRGTARRLRADEPVPDKAVFVVRDLDKAKQEALPDVEAWLAQLKAADSDFPYEAELSAEITRWYALLAQSLPDSEARNRFVLECVQWAQQSVQRSPREYQYRVNLGNALWLRANIEKDQAEKERLLEQSLAAFKTATELFPSSAQVLRSYADAMRAYVEALRGVGDPEAAQMEQQLDKMLRLAEELDAAQLQFYRAL